MPEKYVRAVQDMYEGARTWVKSSVGLTSHFPVSVGLHQGSSPSPHLFAMILDVFASWINELSLYADGIVFCGTRRVDVEKKLEEWRRAMDESRTEDQ